VLYGVVGVAGAGVAGAGVAGAVVVAGTVEFPSAGAFERFIAKIAMITRTTAAMPMMIFRFLMMSPNSKFT
jgi:hypothetical protein